MKKYIFLITVCICTFLLKGQDKILIHNAERILYEFLISDVDSIKFQNNYSVFNSNGSFLEIPVSEIDSITFADGNPPSTTNRIYIIYNNNQVSIINPLKDQGISISNTNASVTVTANSGISNIEYCVSGSSANGALIINSDKSIVLELTDLNLTNPSGSAIHIQKDINAAIQLTGTQNYLSDGSASSQNASLLTKGSLVFSGDGTLNVKGYSKHAISSDKTITVESGAIVITQSVTDGLHSEGFAMKGGSLDITAGGDAIDAGSGAVVMTTGNIKITSNAADVKGIKCDETMTISGGSINMTIAGAQSKGLSSKKDIFFNGGNISIITSGGTALEKSGSGYNPSYCTAIKSDGNITVNNGAIYIDNKSTNNGGKGISADGDITINGGEISITTAGNGATYTNESGTTDSYTSCCIKSDKNIALLGGKINCSSSGTGGKGISAEGTLSIGNLAADNSLLTLNVSTSGERFLVSGSTGGGGGGPGGGGPGGQNNADYANPKAVKSEGNLTVNSGKISINCTQSNEGGEGMESKATLTINGGDIEIHTYDDCINAATHIGINGGNTYCVSTGNDGIDSNGTMTINGGFTISCGTRSPEEGFDCDNNRFAITGGIIVGTGGSTSNPTTSACTQRSIKYTGTAGNAICIKKSTGEIVLLYKMPTYTSSGGGQGGGNSSSMVVLFTDPNLTTGSYVLQYGGTISGGTNVNGYNTGGSYSGGSSKSFTISSMLTTL